MVGECKRPHEIRMMARLLKGVVDRGLRVLYLVSFKSVEFKELSTFAEKHDLQKQIHFLDPWRTENRTDEILRRAQARYQAYQDWRTLQSVFPRDGIYLTPNSFGAMARIARAKLAWEMLEPHLQYDAVMMKGQLGNLSGAIGFSCASRQQPVVTFQHGVISCIPGFVPIAATRHVCFGSSSRELMINLDQDFAKMTGRHMFCQDFILAGSLFDDLCLFPSNQGHSCLLVLDQSSASAARFYGIDHEYDALILVVREMLQRSRVLNKVIIRPHPLNNSLGDWLALAEEWPDRVEISHPALSLQFDLSRSSIALGLFSGAQVTAAACGIPAFFLWEPGWFYTPDLACFAPEFFMSPTDVTDRIETLLTNAEAYTEARECALNAAAFYYNDRRFCDFGPEFVDQLLAPLS
jgi:hypothetical protein